MGNGYARGHLDDEDRTRSLISGILKRLAALETPTGTSINSLVAQVQQAIANINTTVTAAITSLSYTKAQIDNLVANPPAGSNVTGNVAATGSVTAAGNVVSSGQVQSNGSPVKSQPSYGYHVATSYQAMWIDGATFQMGISASSGTVKTDLEPMTDAVEKLLSLTPYWGRYVWDDPDSPPKVFLLAKDVQDAGFGPDVAPVASGPMVMRLPDGQTVLDENGDECVVPEGEAFSINYSQLVVPLLAAVQDLTRQVADLRTELDTLKGEA